MKGLVPIVVFPGTCREALELYREVLGGEIVSLQTFAEAPGDSPR